MNTEPDSQAPAASAEIDSPSDASDVGAPTTSSVAPPAAGDEGSERDKLKQQLLRTAADFDNFRKRSRREIDDAAVRGKELTIREFLPIFDNLERAMSAAESTDDGKAIIEGVRMVLKQFEDTCERIGIRRIPTTGERFDPTQHEAIQQVETDDVPAGAIVTEVAAGYMFGPRLLRAAMVVVARPTTKAAAPSTPPSEGDAE